MFKKLIFVSALTATFAVPAISHAGTSCKSTWVKATSKVETFFVPVGKLVCKGLNTEDEAAAEKCIADLDKFAAKAAEMEAEWNRGEDGSWKIGPRALPHNSPQTGKVSTERQFVGQPVINSTYELTVERTGGKAKKDLIIDVCMVDANGNDVAHRQHRLRAGGDTKEVFRFDGVEGTFPLIHLNNEKWGTNAHQYKIQGAGMGVPAKVKLARQTLRAAKKISTTKR